MGQSIPATYVNADEFTVCVQEYEHPDWSTRVLVRVTHGAHMTLGFDPTPAEALQIAAALTKHAQALLAKAETVEA